MLQMLQNWTATWQWRHLVLSEDAAEWTGKTARKLCSA